MKKQSTFLIGSALVLASWNSFSVEGTTPVGLKVIQSRSFEKNPNEVLRAAETFCKDSGATHAMLLPAHVRLDNEEWVTGSGKVVCMWNAKTSVFPFFGVTVEKSIAKIEVQVEAASRKTGTFRSRIYFHSGLGKTEQITEAEPYTKLYKAIADAVFVQALPITAPIQE